MPEVYLMALRMVFFTHNDRNRTNVAALANQIRNDPMLLAQLNGLHGEAKYRPPDLKEFRMSRLFNKCREASEWNSPAWHPWQRRGVPFGCFATFQVHCVFTNPSARRRRRAFHSHQAPASVSPKTSDCKTGCGRRH